MHVHVINLARSPERLASFMASNTLAEVSVARAIDGASLDLAELERRGLIESNLVQPDYYSIGGVGLGLSHAALWDVAIQSGRPVTVAEDDAILHASFDALAPQVLGALPEGADLILWGFNFDLFACFEMLPGASLCLAQFEQDRLRASIPAFQRSQIRPQAFRLTWAFGTMCYTVTPKGARNLRERCLPLRPMIIPLPEAARAPPFASTYRSVGIDNTMAAHYRDLDAYVCFPPLAVSKNEIERSTVRPL